MISQSEARHSPSLLILGSGIAGLTAALKFSEQISDAQITVVTKGEAIEGSTRYAQGGIASVWSKEDSFLEHETDTLLAGAGLCNPTIVKICVEEGPKRVQELIDYGVAFTHVKDSESDYDLHQEGGHRKRRILHADDLTGLAIETALLEQVRRHPRIRLLDHHVAVDLITEGKLFKKFRKSGRCLGAYVLNANPSDPKCGEVITLEADATVLATGGTGKVYLYTSNPDVATGDGIAMALRAGARVSNLEFMQFHPTCLFHPEAKTFLISEAVRGEGALIRNLKGEAFVSRAHELGSLAPRDVVARAIDAEMKKNGDRHVWLDCSSISEEDFQKKFPNILNVCHRFNIHPPNDPIPVVPAAHYMCGGVKVNEWAQTTIEGLYAIGEVACTGLHGANRLASNSLLEGVVFAHRCVEDVVGRFLPRLASLKANGSSPSTGPLPRWDSGQAVEIEQRLDIAAAWSEIRHLMWNYVGIVRSDSRLEKARRRLELLGEEVHQAYWRFLLTPELIELRNLLLVAEAIVKCASQRKESRGLHTTSDYPQMDDENYGRDTVV